MKTYFEIIKELREDNDKTQKEIAEYLGTTQQVYSRYEKGENEIPASIVLPFANITMFLLIIYWDLKIESHKTEIAQRIVF